MRKMRKDSDIERKDCVSRKIYRCVFNIGKANMCMSISVCVRACVRVCVW